MLHRAALAFLLASPLIAQPLGKRRFAEFMGICQGNPSPAQPHWQHVGWCRHDFSWQAMQPDGPDAWNEAYLDKWRKQILENRMQGVETLPTFSYTAVWAARRDAWSFTVGRKRYDQATCKTDTCWVRLDLARQGIQRKAPYVFNHRVFALAIVPLLLSPGLRAAETNALPNPGFEDGTTAWQVGEGDSLVTAEAARTGKLGLRIVNDRTKAKGSNASSATFVVKPGQPITVTFWARADATGAGVYLMYVSEKGRMVRDPATKGGLPMAGLSHGDNQWHECTIKGTTPAAAHGFKLWAHTFSTAKCVVDLDDFQVTGLPADVQILIPKPYVAPPKPVPLDMANLPRRPVPAVIVLKFDDLKMHGRREHPRWDRVVEYLDKRGVKGTMGMLGNSLPDASPEYIQWIKDRHASGNWEIWFHGWDHKTHAEADGHTYNEFNHRSAAEQKKRLADTQALCIEKLGFPLTCFGPPGGVGNGSQSAETHQMMQDDPRMVSWLYPQPLDGLGKATVGRGKVTILDRVWAVNLEGGVGAPDFERFVRGYIKNLDRPYFVLQGHPVMWDDYRFQQFTRIIDFLGEQKAEFVLPSQYAATLKGGA